MAATVRPLTPKQQRFVDEYLIDLNATAAARRAGYSERTARQVGTENLSKPVIKAAIQAALSARTERTQITADRVLAEYALIAFSDLGQVLDFTAVEPKLRPACDIPEAARRALSSVKVRRYWEGGGEDAREVEVTEFKLWDKMNALEKVGRHVGLFKDRVEVTGAGGGPIQAEVTHDLREDLKPYAAAVADLLAGRLGSPTGGEVPPNRPQ